MQQAEEGTIASQRAALERELLTRPGNVVAVLEEQAVSGRTPISERQALRELESLSTSQSYDELWLFNVDRASRDSDPRAYFHIFGCAMDAGAIILEVKSRHVCEPDTPSGRLWWFMSAESSAAAWESIRAATISGRQRALAEGRPGSASLPWGILHTKQKGWHFDPAPIAAIRLMHQLAQTPTDGHPTGLPLSGIQARLVADGIAPPRGPKWDKATISRMLRRPDYKGELRQKVPGEDRSVTLSIPAAVGEATWQATQEALSSRFNRPTRKYYVKPALLRHMLECSVCGSTMYFRSERERYYCRQCRGRGHPMASVDKAVWYEVSRRLENSDELIAEAIASPPDEDAPALEIADAEAELSRIERKEAGLTARWNQDLLTDESFDRELKNYAERRRLLGQRLEFAQRAKAVAVAARHQRATLGSRLEALRVNIKTADFETRRSIIETMFPPNLGRIVLHPDFRIELHGMLSCEAGSADGGSSGGQGDGGDGSRVIALQGTRRQPPPRRRRPRPGRCRRSR